MQQTAKILKFKGETLKILKDLQAVELAVLADLRSRAVTAREAREIHVQVNRYAATICEWRNQHGIRIYAPAHPAKETNTEKSGN